jgi:hypothetical protein
MSATPGGGSKPPGAAESDEAPRSPPPAGPRRSWRAPQIQSGQLFESNSLACFKSSNTILECGQDPPWNS